VDALDFSDLVGNYQIGRGQTRQVFGIIQHVLKIALLKRYLEIRQCYTCHTGPQHIASPGQRMLALVSGIAGEANRRGRLFMALVYQSFIDDSDAGAGGPFVLAGFVASADAWASFSDEWAAALKAAKPTPIASNRGKRPGDGN
jgi:hypothetical protein